MAARRRRVAVHHMSISVPKGFSVSLPFTITDGPVPTEDTTTALLTMTSADPAVVVVYPDPTAGVANPLRSVRVDAKGNAGTGANITGSFKSPLDNAFHNWSLLVNVSAPPNNGTAVVGTPSVPFLTPA